MLAFHLPHFHGRGEVLHLRSLLNPVTPELVVAYPPLMPVPLVELLEERGVGVVEVPDEEFETMGPNVLGLPGGRALALAGNRVTRQRLETAGVEVVEYEGDEISRQGDGGPTCLTLPVDFGGRPVRRRVVNHSRRRDHMQYLLLINDDEAHWGDMPEDERNAIYADVRDVHRGAAGRRQARRRRRAPARRHGDRRPRPRTARRSRPTGRSPRRRKCSAATT